MPFLTKIVKLTQALFKRLHKFSVGEQETLAYIKIGLHTGKDNVISTQNFTCFLQKNIDVKNEIMADDYTKKTNLPSAL